MAEDKLWLHGPVFLCHPRSTWLKEENEDTDPNDFASETLKHNKSLITKQDSTINVLTYLNSSSSWLKTKKNVAWILRFREMILGRPPLSPNLTVAELVTAEKAIWGAVQKEYFSDILEILGKEQPKNQKQLKKKSNIRLQHLSPFIDKHGLLRVGGRLENSDLSYDAKHQIILPSKSPVVETLIRETHENVGHLGRETVLSTLRTRYWLLNANSRVRKVLSDCVSCRKRNQKTSEQIMANLPEDRVRADTPVFSCVGLDCFGPFLVSRGRGKATEKRYGIIFTCLTSRACHIECANSLDTDSFINALRRFIARRGPVSLIRCDNAGNFTRASKELKIETENWNSTQIEDWLLQRSIEWKFQPPLGSHHGGVFEREIQTAKKVLNALMEQQEVKLDHEGLTTLFCEVEWILNSRPLTPISNDPLDKSPLTPNQILLLKDDAEFPPALRTADGDSSYPTRRWKRIQYLADIFWSRWKREYLPLLQPKSKWKKEKRSLQEGDLVLVTSALAPRGKWSMGLIESVHRDKHGHVRVAHVKIGSRLKDANRCTILERPITKLILLKKAEDLKKDI